MPDQEIDSPSNLMLDAEGHTVATNTSTKQPLTISDLGWSQEMAAQVRGLFSSFSDWDYPSMDVYDDVCDP